MWQFVYMDKIKKELFLPRLYNILYNNMSVIAPTGNSKREDYLIWHKAISEGLEKPQRQIVLIKNGRKLAGYIQYAVGRDVLIIEEIELKPIYHRSAAFFCACKFIYDNIPNDIEFIESYARVENDRSIKMQLHFGLELVGTIHDRTLHFKAKTSDIIKKHPYMFKYAQKEVNI